MSNIWDFLAYTLDLSLWVGLILVLKRIFKNALSPVWQYGIWLVLVFRSVYFLIVANTDLNTSIIVSYIEGKIEPLLASNYGSFSLAAPNSITDWLFVVYIAGIIGFVMYYILRYIQLKIYINKHSSKDLTNEALVKTVCQKYGFKSKVRVLNVQGISSAFICGVFRPILVLPKGELVDEKVLIHEFIHLKNRDHIKSIYWCCLRCTNWCNPIMHWTIDHILNDAEMACDQKVLERLEGEQLKDYGRILIFMADEKYSKVMGTTSIANGGANIKKRIEAILYFKKYPRDLNIVSSCMIFMIILMIMLN